MLIGCSWASEPAQTQAELDHGLSVASVWLHHAASMAAAPSAETFAPLRQHVLGALKEVGVPADLSAGAAGADGADLKVTLLPAGEDGRHQVRLDLAPQKGARGAQAFTSIVNGPWPSQAHSLQAWQPALTEALGDIVATARATKKGSAAVLARLGADTSVNAKLMALDALAQSGDPQVVKPLCRLMQQAFADGDDGAMAAKVRARIVGALVELGDQQAVPALIAASKQQDPNTVAQLALAIGGLGGRLARAYLVTLAGGHGDPQVRQSAQLALEASLPAAP